MKFTHAGEAVGPDGKADTVDVEGPDGWSMRLFFDQETHLPLMASYRADSPPRMVMRTSRMPAGDSAGPRKETIDGSKPEPPKLVEYQLRDSDYAKTGGIQSPVMLTISTEGHLVEEWDIKKYTVNPPLTPDEFKKKWGASRSSGS